MRDVTRSGPQPWLPTEEDFLAGKVDDKILALDAWKLQIHCGALALLAESFQSPSETFTLEFPAPSRTPSRAAIGKLSMSIESVDVDGVELGEVFLVASVLDRKQIKAVDLAVQVARAALQSDAEVWHSTTYTDDAYAFSALIDPAARAYSEELARTENLPVESVPGVSALASAPTTPGNMVSLTPKLRDHRYLVCVAIGSYPQPITQTSRLAANAPNGMTRWVWSNLVAADWRPSKLTHSIGHSPPESGVGPRCVR